MALYTYDCIDGHTFDAFASIISRGKQIICKCGASTIRRTVYHPAMKMGDGAMPPKGDPEVYHQLDKAMKKTSYPPSRVYDELRQNVQRDAMERPQVNVTKMTKKVETRRS